jgi:hypothetical protein
MNPIDRESKAANADARYRVMLILWFAMLMSTAVLFSLTLLIERPRADGSESVVWILMALAVSVFLLSFILRRKLQAQAVAGQRPELVQSAMILALALCEAAAIFGLLIYFVSTTPYYYLFFIIGLVGMLLHLPRRDQLLAASYKAQA